MPANRIRRNLVPSTPLVVLLLLCIGQVEMQPANATVINLNYDAWTIDARPYRELSCIESKARICENIPLHSLYVREIGERLELPCQLIEVDEKIIVMDWYRLEAGCAKILQRIRFDVKRRVTFLGFFNLSRSDDGFYFCSILYQRDSTRLEKFYEAVTKPLITYVKVTERKSSELVSGIVSDGIREFAQLILEDNWYHRNKSELIKMHEGMSLALNAVTTVMILAYLVLWGILAVNDYRVVRFGG